MFSRILRSVALGVQRPKGSRLGVQSIEVNRGNLDHLLQTVPFFSPITNFKRELLKKKRKIQGVRSRSPISCIPRSLFATFGPLLYPLHVRAQIGLGVRVLCTGICLCYEMQSNLRVYVTLLHLALRFHIPRARRNGKYFFLTWIRHRKRVKRDN